MTLLRNIDKSKSIPRDDPDKAIKQRKAWDKHFNMKAVETCTRHFYGSIFTDGSAVSVLLQRPGTPTTLDQQKTYYNLSDEQSTRIDAAKRIRVVGIDPGVTDIVTMTEAQLVVNEWENRSACELHAWLSSTLTTDKRHSSSYSSSRYYHNGLVRLSARRTSKWNEDTETLVQSIAPCKVSTIVEYSEHVQSYLAVFRDLMLHRASKGYRNLRFARYVAKQKALDDIIDTIIPSKTEFCVVGFGDWAGLKNSPISRKTCGPLKEIKNRLRGMDNVVVLGINEYKTSVTNFHNHAAMERMKAKSVVKKRDGTRVKQMTRVHKVLHCKTSVVNGQGRFESTCNRDINASRNMLLLTCFTICGFARPTVFTRATVRGHG
jgi:hypothetical protein